MILTTGFGKAPNALGNGFAECHTQQRALAKYFNGKELFAEC